MHILFVIRADAERNLGGDTIQMHKTRAALEALGHRVEVRGADALDALPAADIAHLFNIQTEADSWAALQSLEAAGIPTVLSPIFWDMLDHWFEFAIQQRSRWRIPAGLLGKMAARRLYTAWQRARAPATDAWRTRRRLLRRAVRVLPNSRSEADLLERTFALGPAFSRKVDVVPNGIDAPLFDPSPLPSREFAARYGLNDFVLEVGAISPVKNQLGLIEALWDLPTPIVFVGQPAAAMPDYAELCKARGAERGDVHFIERMPHEELPGIYALASVHALPSWRETPGLASLEAAAAGCRIVTTSIGSTRDYFRDSAWYCYPDDLHSIRTAVQASLDAPPSGALRERVLSEYTWERAAEATLSAYEKVLVSA